VTAASGAPKRLLFFVTEDWYFHSHRLPLAIAAARRGYDVAVVTRVRAHGDQIRAAGIRLIPLEAERSSLNPLHDLALLARLVAIYRRERPDVVHHVAMKPVLYGSMAARVVGVPRVVNALAGMGWVFTASSPTARVLSPAVRAALARALRRGIVIVQNPDDEALVGRLGVNGDAIARIAGSGVDLDTFVRTAEPAGPPVVLFPARLLRDKGVGEFVEAARRLRAEGAAARFLLAGDPDPVNPSAISQDVLSSWIAEGVVEHLGWVTDMARLFQECHVVCLPSYREGLPKSLIEASAAGRPIVTTDVPGCREVVINEHTGLLVPARDAHALAESVRRLILDPALRARMGLAARERAERYFGLSDVIDQTLAVYERAV